MNNSYLTSTFKKICTLVFVIMATSNCSNQISWGGVTSLAISYPDLMRPNADFSGRLVRFNIGLEDPDDLINDLHKAMTKASIRISSPI